MTSNHNFCWPLSPSLKETACDSTIERVWYSNFICADDFPRGRSYFSLNRLRQIEDVVDSKIAFNEVHVSERLMRSLSSSSKNAMSSII